MVLNSFSRTLTSYTKASSSISIGSVTLSSSTSNEQLLDTFFFFFGNYTSFIMFTLILIIFIISIIIYTNWDLTQEFICIMNVKCKVSFWNNNIFIEVLGLILSDSSDFLLVLIDKVRRYNHRNFFYLPAFPCGFYRSFPYVT